MPSEALRNWEGQRQVRLDELVAAHRRVAGTGPGRRWATGQLNASLVFRLASEFQGFARELHDEAADVFADRAAPENAVLRNVIRGRLTEGRHLDRGNAQPAAIGSDFGRFGFQVWPTLTQRNRRTPVHQATCDKLNELRNAIAHDQPAKLDELRQEGYPVTLVTFNRARTLLGRLSVTLDAVLAAHLAALFDGPEPW